MSLENPHANYGLTIDLALEQDFFLPGLRVIPSAREVIRDGVAETLEPRVMQVLVALARAEGAVVSRDELILRCWEGRVVGEDSINRVIWRLRRLAENGGLAPFVIETIPRVGYRLKLGRAGPLPTPVKVAPAKPGELSGAAILGRVALVALVAVGCGLLVWASWPERRWGIGSSRTFISSLAQEGEPAFASDGGMIAYLSGPEMRKRKVYVRNLAGGDGIRLTGGSSNDMSPTWSSDGARLAYVAENPGEPCSLMVTTVPAGGARQVGRCRAARTASVAWQPGTSFLYYTDRTDGGGSAIFRLDLDTGAIREEVRPQGMNVHLSDLRCSPDGKSLLYIQQQTIAQQPITVRDLASGREKLVGAIDGAAGIGSAAWSEDSRTVLASVPNLNGSEITAFPVGGGNPYRVYATVQTAGHLAAGGGLLALETDIRRSNLARAGTRPDAQPDVIDAAGGFNFSPTFAANGTLAFLSNRSGSNAVWVIRPGAAPAKLFDAGLAPLGREQFSPDGTRLAVASRTANGAAITILTADGARLVSFDVPSVGFGTPTWTPDGKAVIVFDRSTSRAILVSIDDPSQRSAAAPAGWGAVAMRDGETYAARADRPGIWRMDGEPERINAAYPAAFDPPLAFRGDDVLIPDFDAAGGPRILAQPLAGGADRVVAYAPGAEDRPGSQTRIAVNPVTDEIVYVAMLHDTNIDLLTLALH